MLQRLDEPNPLGLVILILRPLALHWIQGCDICLVLFGGVHKVGQGLE